MDILEEIVAKRKKQIEELGWNFGIDIPLERKRPVVPFMEKKGLILEVKRASPSKGDIAPGLDSVKTALAYADAGAAAVSVLTEENYFKGSLRDLKAVSSALGDKKVAVLRKDFLIDPCEIEIAFRCGADAVLLIARILSVKDIVKMAEKCSELGICAFVEIRLKEDLEKLKELSRTLDSSHIVCGVNARDLSDFSIDLLAPAAMLKGIREILGPDARIIFESGITSPQAASFASSLGFTGLLLGEAAARNPKDAPALVKAFVTSKPSSNAAFWLSYAEKLRLRKEKNPFRPFTKICGITSVEDALYAASCGADFFGFILYPKSPRAASISVIRESHQALVKSSLRKNIVITAVIVEPSSSEAKEAYQLVDEGLVDLIQCHGLACAHEFLADSELSRLPHYCAVNLKSHEDFADIQKLSSLGEARILIDSKSDGKIGGTGKTIEGDLVKDFAKKNKVWLAGGVNPDNISSIISEYSPELVDCASGVEEAPGVKSKEKIKKLLAF